MPAFKRKPIPGFPGYFADREGHIYGPRCKLRPYTMPSGHQQVVLGRKGGSQLVHRAVLLAYVGPAPDGTECLHKNGDPADNRLDNLHWGTRADNIRDKKWHGKPRKLHVHEVLEIKAALHAGGPRGFQRALARQHGVHETTISAIKVERTHEDV